MSNRVSRILLAISAAILALGGLMHARVYGKAAAAVASSDLPAFYGDSLRALWLIDSATLIVLAIVFALVVIRPMMTSGAVIVLLALIPAATAMLLYRFIGNFLPAHMLLSSAILAGVAGLFHRR